MAEIFSFDLTLRGCFADDLSDQTTMFTTHHITAPESPAISASVVWSLPGDVSPGILRLSVVTENAMRDEILNGRNPKGDARLLADIEQLAKASNACRLCGHYTTGAAYAGSDRIIGGICQHCKDAEDAKANRMSQLEWVGWLYTNNPELAARRLQAFARCKPIAPPTETPEQFDEFTGPMDDAGPRHDPDHASTHPSFADRLEKLNHELGKIVRQMKEQGGAK